MPEWTPEELRLFELYKNPVIAEITGRSLEEIRDRRERWNLERHGWLDDAEGEQ